MSTQHLKIVSPCPRELSGAQSRVSPGQRDLDFPAEYRFAVSKQRRTQPKLVLQCPRSYVAPGIGFATDPGAQFSARICPSRRWGRRSDLARDAFILTSPAEYRFAMSTQPIIELKLLEDRIAVSKELNVAQSRFLPRTMEQVSSAEYRFAMSTQHAS